MESSGHRRAEPSARHWGPALAMSLTIVLAGCTGPDPGPAQSTSIRVSASGPGAAPQATGSATVPATAATPEEAVHLIAMMAADLPADWSVEESPTDANIDNDPTFLGLCGYEFRSESHRTAKDPVTGIDPQGDAVLTTEAVSYDQADNAALALVELRAAYQNCPLDQTFSQIPVSDQTGLSDDRVVVEYTLAEGTVQTVIVQRRGSVLSVVLGEARLITFDVARRIYQRMAALSPVAAGDV